MKVVAVIPAYNEAATVAATVQRTRTFVDEVLVIDDGSSDATAALAAEAGARVVRHPINRGLGASLTTGFAAALARRADHVITLDADSQHDPAAIPDFLAALEAGAEVVIGSRMLTRRGMPWHRQIAQVIGNLVTLILFGVWVTDSQSGFRAFTASALSRMHLRTNRMEISSEIVAEAKARGLQIREIPIAAIYTSYSLSKGQNFFVGLATVVKLILRRLHN